MRNKSIEIDGKTVIICGRTCSGKTTLRNALVEHGYSNVITYTTRERRPDEINGVDYYFISKSVFEYLIAQSFFLEYVEYGTDEQIVYYGSAKYSFSKNTTKVIILDPRGTMSVIKKYGAELFYVLWLDIPEETCLKRAIKRGTSSEKLIERLVMDIHSFDVLAKTHTYNLRITKEMTVDELVTIVDAQVGKNEKEITND